MPCGQKSQGIFVGIGAGFVPAFVVSLSVKEVGRMPKNRTIPFGYCMRNGELKPELTEAEAIKDIFSEYLSGKSFLQIARLMECKNIRYSLDSDKWNKNMVKRIIENEKYLGTERYPRLVDDDTYEKANKQRVKKATALCEIPDELQEIRNHTYCSECGHRLSRAGGNTRTERWDCKNEECSKLEFRLTDAIIIDAIRNVINKVIADPTLIHSDKEVSSYKPSLNVIRQQSEIDQMVDSQQIDYDRVKAEIIKLAQMKYDCCTYSDSKEKTAELKVILQNKQQLKTLDIDLFKSCVSRIWISHSCVIEVEFINGIRIKNTAERGEINECSA